MIIFEYDSLISKYVDYTNNFIIYRNANDDTDNYIADFAKTEEEAIKKVQKLIDDYGDVPEFQYFYEQRYDRCYTSYIKLKT